MSPRGGGTHLRVPLELALHSGAAALLRGRGGRGEAEQLAQPLVAPHCVEDLVGEASLGAPPSKR